MKRTGELFAAGAMSLSLLAACGGEAKPDPSVSPSADTARCRASGEWGGVPTNLNVDFLAKQLGTTAAAVREGISGYVKCDPPFSGEAVLTNSAIGEVSGLSDLPIRVGRMCAMVFVYGGPPLRGASYSEFDAVCPREVLGTPGPSPADSVPPSSPAPYGPRA